MSLAFLVPAALAALAALLLPLLIHLARRSEQRPTQFAALRWLRQKPKPRHRIRFDEWPLLLLRLLLVLLLALLLAAPVLHGARSDAPYVAVVPGVDVAQARKTMPERARWHWLAPGFPAIEAADSPSSASVTSLLRELDANLPMGVALTVFVPAQLQDADGQRLVLSRQVDWRVLPGAMPARVARPDALPALAVRADASRESSLRYLRAAHSAWQPPNGAVKLDEAPPSQDLAPATRVLAWFVPGVVPARVHAWVGDGGTVLLDPQAVFEGAGAMAPLWRDDSGVTLVEGTTFGEGRVLRFTRALTPGSMPQVLEATFPQRLRALLAPPANAPTRVLAQSHGPVAGGPAFPVSPRDLQPWLALLTALVFVLERWLASGARRQVAP